MLNLLYETIAEIQDIKRYSKVFPDYATIHEIHNSLKPEYGEKLEQMKEQILQGLRMLYRAKKINFHKTVNGILMFSINQQNDTTNT